MRRPCPAVRTLKGVSIEGEQLLLTVSQQESNRRFVYGFRWDHVAISGDTVNQNEHRWLILVIRSAYREFETTEISGYRSRPTATDHLYRVR